MASMTLHDVYVWRPAPCTLESLVNGLSIYPRMMFHQASKPLPSCKLPIQVSQFCKKSQFGRAQSGSLASSVATLV